MQQASQPGLVGAFLLHDPVMAGSSPAPAMWVFGHEQGKKSGTGKEYSFPVKEYSFWLPEIGLSTVTGKILIPGGLETAAKHVKKTPWTARKNILSQGKNILSGCQKLSSVHCLRLYVTIGQI